MIESKTNFNAENMFLRKSWYYYLCD